MTVLVTGGCGFIGGAIIRRLVVQGVRVVNLDKLAHAATPEALADIPTDRCRLVVGDVCDRRLVETVLEAHAPEAVVHCAAETQVDRSVDTPGAFLASNVTGTFTVLEAVRAWSAGRRDALRFLNVSTDKVYGSLGPFDPPFTENSPHAPNSPYAASKSAADHMVRAWGQTYGVPVLTTNCSNNYGPWEFPERLVPLAILNGIEERPITVHGNGRSIRDWLHVDDHADAVWTVLQHGEAGRTYNVGGNSQLENVEVVRRICDRLDERLPGRGARRRLITHVTERAGHDARRSVDSGRIRRELGWRPSRSFDRGLAQTVDWYLENAGWWKKLRSPADDSLRPGPVAGSA